MLGSASSVSEDLSIAICLPLLVSLARPQDAKAFPRFMTLRNGENRPLRCGSLTSSSMLSCSSMYLHLSFESPQNAKALRIEAGGPRNQHRRLQEAAIQFCYDGGVCTPTVYLHSSYFMQHSRDLQGALMRNLSACLVFAKTLQCMRSLEGDCECLRRS